MIFVKNLTKIYKGYSKPTKRLWTVLSLGFYQGDVFYPALQDLSFEVQKGEILGIIGRNGAGKSTLLKILTGVTGYDFGTVKVKGSLSSLLELGVGFNPELTGQENLYYNSLLYGFSPDEIQKAEKEIFEFASLEEFKNIPLKNYSSGMNVRLGFALASFKRPDILLIDEALSVGDASFQQKSLKRIESFVSEGTCVIVVSHDLHLLSSFCNRILVLEKGKLIIDSIPKKALEKYMEVLALAEEESHSKISYSSILEYYNVSIFNSSGISTTTFLIQEQITLKINFSLKQKIEGLTVGFHIEDSRGIRVFGTNSHILKTKAKPTHNLNYSCSFQFPICFREGKYSLSISIHKGDSHIEGCLLWKEGVIDFEVERINLPKFEGLVYTPVKCSWH